MQNAKFALGVIVALLCCIILHVNFTEEKHKSSLECILTQSKVTIISVQLMISSEKDCSVLQAHIKVVSLYRAFHSVILFCSNSIKLIVFLGNYPQPPAGQISIHDLNNAY